MNRPEPIGAPPFRDSLPEPKPGSLSARARAAVGPQAAAYLAGLNPEQRQAVEATEGPVLVLAGAGTGKTRVLTTRIAHLIATAKARPFDILAVTFTNKAAREMKERVGALVGSVAEGMPWLGTFHSIGTKVLRRHAELVGLKSDFTILGVDDQLRLMKQVIEAADIDEKRWPARQLAAQIDGWKNRGLDPDARAAGRGRRLRLRQGRRALRRLSGPAEDPQRRRFRRPPARMPAPVARQPRRARPLPAPLPLHAGRRVPGHERRPVPVAAPAGADAARTSAASATTTSRSMAGAAPRSTTSCASSTTSRARKVIRLERNYRSTGHILAAASTPHRQERGPARQDAAHRRRARREGHRHRRLGFGGGGAPDRRGDRGAARATSTTSPRSRSWCASRRRCARSRTGFVTLGLPYRVIGGPRFYERRRDPRRARLSARDRQPGRRPRLRAHRQRAEARPRRRDAATRSTRHARRASVPLMQAARYVVETDELKPKPRATLRDLLADLRALGAARSSTAPHQRARADHPGGIRLHRHVAEGPLGRRRRAAREPEGARALDGGVPRPRRPSSSMSRWSWRRTRASTAERVSPDDAARRQGPGVRHRVPARLGGRAVPLTSARSTRAAGPGSRRSAASPMSG